MEKTEDKIRYHLDKSLRIGVGGYGGFSLNTVLKLKYYNEEGELIKQKSKDGFDRNNLVYGVTSYIGFGDVLLYICF